MSKAGNTAKTLLFLQFIGDVTRVSSDWTGGFSREGAGRQPKVYSRPAGGAVSVVGVSFSPLQVKMGFETVI